MDDNSKIILNKEDVRNLILGIYIMISLVSFLGLFIYTYLTYDPMSHLCSYPYQDTPSFFEFDPFDPITSIQKLTIINFGVAGIISVVELIRERRKVKNEKYKWW